MSNTAPTLTANEATVLAALVSSTADYGGDFGLTSDVDFAALGLTAQGFAATFGSLASKGAFEWTSPEADANGKPLGTQFGLAAWAREAGR